MGPRRRSVAVGLVAVVLAAGCASRDGAGDPTASPSTSASPTTPGATDASLSTSASPSRSPSLGPIPTSTPSPTTEPSPTASEDPLVLAAQFSAFVGGIGGPGDGACSLGIDELPALRLFEATQLSIGESASVCFLGFDLADPVHLDVAWPGGSRTVDVVFAGDAAQVDLRTTPGPLHGWVDDDGSGRLWAGVAPGTPRGDWRLAASQGDVVATLGVVAAPATTPRMVRSLDSDGDTLRLVVSGFPPREVPLGLYRLPDPRPDELLPPDRVTATLERELATVLADADGTAVLEVDLGDVGPGWWCIDSAVTIDNGWCEATFGGSG